jgi:hypothetical protein
MLDADTVAVLRALRDQQRGSPLVSLAERRDRPDHIACGRERRRVVADENERHHLLRDGLVGERYRHLWHTSPDFRASVECLARLLPLFVDGLAAHAAGVGQRRAEELERVLRQPPILRLSPAEVEAWLDG